MRDVLHPGEAGIDRELVRSLIVAQFPRWSALPIERVRSSGTVNVIFRLGADLCVRLPRLAEWADGIESEVRWLPLLAPHLTLPVPEPVAIGEPQDGYPSSWAVYRWVPGEAFTRGSVVDESEAAGDLARFVAELRRIDTAGAPRSTRDDPIHRRLGETAEAIEGLAGVVDTGGVMAAWESSMQAPRWDGSPVWTHGDLLPTNVLVLAGKLSGIVDFGLAGVGDPAVDLIPAWTMFGSEGRRAFREVLDVDEGSWARARGFALHQALLIIPYYRETDPDFVAMAQGTIDEVIADHRG